MAPTPPAAHVKNNADGSVTINYVPSQSGVHDIHVTYKDRPVSGTPIRVSVDNENGNFVSAYGIGLNQGGSGRHVEFFLTGLAKDFGITIKGPGKADVLKKEDNDGTVHVEYMPMSPGQYEIHVTHKGKPIHGSPFAAKISGEGRKRSQISSKATSEYNIGGKDVDFANMVGVLKSPNGSTENCLLKRMLDGRLGIASFQPRSKGVYQVEVTQEDKPIEGSPFKITVSDNHICSANKVHLSGATRAATANVWNDVHINIADAGYGSLGISIEGEHRSHLELTNSTATDYELRYKPHEPGVYLVNIKFGDEHVSGSPYMIVVGGEPSGRIRETVVQEIHTVPAAEKGQACQLEMKIPGTDPLEMEATISSPGGMSQPCEIRGMPEDLCTLKFKPMEDGVNTISLKFKGIHFAGSPFQYTVGKVPAGGTNKVVFGGPGVEQGEVDSKNEFNIYYREAGAGTLSISVEGPSKAKMEVVDRGSGYVTVAYNVSKPGDYGIHVKFNDEHVPESPAQIRVLPMSRDAKKVSLVGLKSQGNDVDKPVTFCVQLNGAGGDLKAVVHTPSGTVDDVFMSELDEDKVCLRFTPKENGVHYVTVKLNEAHIRGSPVPFLIGKQGSDPALVFATGPGLEAAECGKSTVFKVVTVNAGAGTLAVIVDGPSKVALACQEEGDGYAFIYTPMSPGIYTVMIKYSNVNIAGAPFKTIVSGDGKKSEIDEVSSLVVETSEKKPGQTKAKRFHGDAKRVVAQGNGLKKGFSGRSATFTFDVKDAGQALLTLGMISPSGNPVTELTFKKAKPTIYNVNYTPAEKGDHTLIIRWGAEDIPGSPFTIPVS